MVDFGRLAVIKTGWCDSYDGGDVTGNFTHLLAGAAGAERFNMQPTEWGYQVYALPKGEGPPSPVPAQGWTVVHAARDPAERKIKMVGWYEDATFLGIYCARHDESGDGKSIYCIEASRAFALLPVDRPVVDHDGRFRSSGIFWLRGNDQRTGRSWKRVAQQLERLVIEMGQNAFSGQDGLVRTSQRLGGTIIAPKACSGLSIDDGGTAFGRSDAESPEHRALRCWALGNPTSLTGRQEKFSSQTEWRLPSGDEVDAMHSCDGHLWLVEAKSRRSGERDLERGVFQCVKYRAVAEAMQKGAKNKAQVHAILLTEAPLSTRLQALVRRHRITHVERGC